jgi:hypothetical protein
MEIPDAKYAVIPPVDVAHQIPPPPVGTIPRALYNAFGPSYRTTLAGWATGALVLVTGVIQQYPDLLPAKWRGPVQLLLSLAVGGGVAKMGSAAKDKSVSGVEK